VTLHDLGYLGPIDAQAHGSRPCYQAGCRCLACASANACYEAQRVRARQRGLSDPWVDAAPARAKLAQLGSRGIGHRRAAQLAGIAVKTARAIRSGRHQRIRRHVEQAILRIERPSLAHGSRVNGYRTRARLDALKREGFTLAGLRLRGLRSVARQMHAARVTVRSALLVDALYQRLLAESPTDMDHA